MVRGLLAEFGADVIRIEKRTGGEDRYQAPLTQSQEGGLFLQMNRNKRGMTLDPMTADGQEIVRKLVQTADVVVANLPPQTLSAMKLDYESLAAVKSDIILTMVTAYGQGGPYSNRVGFDGIGQVMSGAAYMTADADGERPYRFQAPWVDFGTALHCAYGTVLALMARQQTGRGQVVEGALLATALTVGNALLIEQAVKRRA
jgi:crotonobetainyl-CoA:carnitine CoA-transferase CaiB-like acyl-CoA transferase